MYVSRFRVALVVIILSAIICAGSAVAMLDGYYYIIPSSGSISPLAAQPSVAYESEMRAVFLHFTSLSLSNDWNLIAQTLHNYDISLIAAEVVTPLYAAYPSDVVQRWASAIDIHQAVSKLHALGIQFYAVMDTLYLTPPEKPIQCVLADGSQFDWVCPTKEVSRNYLKAIVEELVRNYPEIDGFMFDFHRYEMRLDMCYCSECKAALEAWLGETIAVWSGDFAPGGLRHKEFLEWRIEPITKLLVDMIGWMKAIKPNLKISAAPWTLYMPTGPAERFKWLGQDWIDWVMKGYLDWVAPMIYTYPYEAETTFRSCVRGDVEIATGGPEGKVPLVIFIANQYPVLKTPAELKAEVDVLREEGADGWIIWRYTGPGVGGVDIQPYLDAIDLFNVFSLRDISASPTDNSCTITWTTDLPATSKVEYSTSPLFDASRNYDPLNDFDYWDIDHVEGTVVEDVRLVTSHSITLAGLQEGTLYYYRVQSGDQSGIATSGVYEFTTGV